MNSLTMTKHQPLTLQEAKDKISDILENGTVKISDHLVKDRLTLRSLSRKDIRLALANGQVVEREWEDRYQNWKYQVDGFDIEGDGLTSIIVFFDSDFSLLVITAY